MSQVARHVETLSLVTCFHLLRGLAHLTSHSVALEFARKLCKLRGSFPNHFMYLFVL